VRVAIARRIERAQAGNLGDYKSIEKNVSEMRLSIGPGYRIYYTQRGANLIILLVGGEKSSQQKDITRAKALAKEY
jgi:putative addiction module killer protein